MWNRIVLVVTMLVACAPEEEEEEEGGTFSGGATAPGPSGGQEYGVCGPQGTELDDLQVDFTIHRVLGVDREVSMLGTPCLMPAEEGWSIDVQWGPPEGADRPNLLFVRVPAAGTYDLTTDFGVPLSEELADAALAYTWVDGNGARGFGTQTEVGDGTLQVDAWPESPEDPIDVRADGNLGGADGWVFQFMLKR